MQASLFPAPSLSNLSLIYTDNLTQRQQPFKTSGLLNMYKLCLQEEH